MAASRFRSLSEENIAQLLNDKDSENTKKSTKQHRLILSLTSRRKTSEIVSFILQSSIENAKKESKS